MPHQDFLPQEYLDKRIQRRTNFISLTLFVIVMGSVIAAYMVTDQQRVAKKHEMRQVGAQFNRAAEQIDELESLKQRKAQMLAKAEVTGMLTERPNRTLLLSELINRMPATLSLLSFEMNTSIVRRAAVEQTAMQRGRNEARRRRAGGGDDEPQSQVQPTEVSIEIVGVAPTNAELSQFLSAIQRCPLYKDVNMVSSVQTNVEGQAMYRFRLVMNVDQELDLGAYEPIMVQRGLRQNPMSPNLEFDSDGFLVTPEGPHRDQMEQD